jgi:plasmid stabilization system protein ParE
MRLELSRFVESDLDDIAGYIAQDNPGALSASFRRFAQNFARYATTRCSTSSGLTSGMERA